MGVKQYKPTTAGRRVASVNDYAELTDKRSRPAKSLTERLVRTGGRNHHGVITSRHRGGGARRIYRRIDFKRRKDDVEATVLRIEYDPNRSCHIALVQYTDGEKRYILAPTNVRTGDVVESGQSVEPRAGNCMPLRSIPVGLDVHNIEMNPGQGGKLVRSAGNGARLLAREGEWATLVLPSGEMRQVRSDCRATIGVLGNGDHQNLRLGRAGRKRHLGRRPHVGGNAMNPHDHPMGGGEGHRKGGRHPCSPQGVLAKGGRTRKRGRSSSRRILRRRKSKRYGQLTVSRK